MIKNTNPGQWPALPQRVEPPSPQTGPSVTSMCAGHHGCSCCTLQREGDTSEIFDTEHVRWPMTNVNRGNRIKKWNRIDLLTALPGRVG